MWTDHVDRAGAAASASPKGTHRKKKTPREEQSRGAEPLEHHEYRMNRDYVQLPDDFNLTFAQPFAVFD